MEDNLAAALEILKKTREAALATLDGLRPFVSAVGYLYEEELPEAWGKIILLLSDLAQHTKNIKASPQVSLLVVENGSGPIHERRRLTVEGRSTPVAKEKFSEYQNKYLRAFPKSGIFFTLSDFRFWEISIEKLHWYGGFGKAQSWQK